MKIGEKPKLRYEADGDRYIVMFGDDRAGFVRHQREGSQWRSGEWHASDTFMSKNRKFRTRREAGAWLQKETERAIADGEL